MTPKPTTEILVDALFAAAAPQFMIAKAQAGEYDDYKAQNTATPCVDLVNDLGKAATENGNMALLALRDRAMKGEFDAQPWESDAWAKSMESDPEMGPLLKQMKEVWS